MQLARSMIRIAIEAVSRREVRLDSLTGKRHAVANHTGESANTKAVSQEHKTNQIESIRGESEALYSSLRSRESAHRRGSVQTHTTAPTKPTTAIGCSMRDTRIWHDSGQQLLLQMWAAAAASVRARVSANLPANPQNQ